jgi:hypothetical protein
MEEVAVTEMRFQITKPEKKGPSMFSSKKLFVAPLLFALFVSSLGYAAGSIPPGSPIYGNWEYQVASGDTQGTVEYHMSPGVITVHLSCKNQGQGAEVEITVPALYTKTQIEYLRSSTKQTRVGDGVCGFTVAKGDTVNYFVRGNDLTMTSIAGDEWPTLHRVPQ